MTTTATHRFTVLTRHLGGHTSQMHFDTYEMAEEWANRQIDLDASLLPNCYSDYNEEEHGLSSSVWNNGNVWGVILHTVKRNGAWKSYCQS